VSEYQRLTTIAGDGKHKWLGLSLGIQFPDLCNPQRASLRKWAVRLRGVEVKL